MPGPVPCLQRTEVREGTAVPLASPRPCAQPACPGLVRDRGRRYCDEHQQLERDRRRTLDRGRRKTTERGYGARWRQASLGYLAAHPWCGDPYEVHLGVVRLATQVDHIIPHRDNAALFWDRGNWQGLCADCHRWKTAQDILASQQALPPIDLPVPACQVVLVCGPPGAGKSTWVERERAACDIVIDLDVIKAQLANVPIYQAGDEWVRPALAERDRQLAELARQPATTRAWVILTAPKAEQRDVWSRALQASVVVLRPPEIICRGRILDDERRPPAVKRAGCHAMQHWFHVYRVRASEQVLRRY